jgi:molybdopterin converting factor small subunit
MATARARLQAKSSARRPAPAKRPARLAAPPKAKRKEKPKAASNGAIQTVKGAKVTVVFTGKVREVSFKAGMTLRDALLATGPLPDRSQEVRVNNTKTTDFDAKLKASDQVMVIGQTSGG